MLEATADPVSTLGSCPVTRADRGIGRIVMLDSTSLSAEPAPQPAAGEVALNPGVATTEQDGIDRIRVLIVDDHAVVRTGLRAFFELLDDIEVVGEASDGSEGVASARRLRPDVVLMDILMPRLDGISAISRIKADNPKIEIVTMTSFIEEEKVTAALEAGASGYVLKDAQADEVADAVRAAHRGEVHLDPAVARLLAQRIRARTADPVQASPLTDREQDVLRLVARGLANKEIAFQLSISERTARTYVSNILGKLGLQSRTQAALWAVAQGLADRPDA